jgi:hypothetical protein
MTRAQQWWCVASLVLTGLVLIRFALEWDARPPRDQGVRLVTIYESNSDQPFPSDLPPPPPGFVLVSGERLLHGFFVRREWGPTALLWGGLLPLCLFAVAGFIALAKRN